MIGKRYKNSNYVIYSDGRIWSDYSIGFWKRYTDNGIGYMQVGMNLESGKKKKMYVHRLVAEMFVPNTENKSCVNHKDGNKLNNSADNLEWVSHRENMNHAIATGLVPINLKNWV